MLSFSISLLMEAGVDINSEDHDGWTPLHAAAHWGQEEACRVLVENMCDMMHKNKAVSMINVASHCGTPDLLERFCFLKLI